MSDRFQSMQAVLLRRIASTGPSEADGSASSEIIKSGVTCVFQALALCPLVYGVRQSRRTSSLTSCKMSAVMATQC